MAIVRERCQFCSSEIDVSVGQSVYDGKLVWHKGYSCPICGGKAEEDGRGSAPYDIRSAILQRDGEWALRMDDAGSGITTGLKLLRQALNLSLREIAVLRKRLPGDVVTGTRAEMERLKAILSAEDIHATVVKISDNVSHSG